MSEEIKKEEQDAELNLEDLENAAGGVIKEEIFRHEIYGEQKRYEVYNDFTGELLCTTKDKAAAIKFAEAVGVSTDTFTFVHEMNN